MVSPPLTFFIVKQKRVGCKSKGTVLQKELSLQFNQFLLPLAQGACSVVGGNIVTDAFGIVAMVAMTPLITIQVMGLASRMMEKRREKRAAMQPVPAWSLELLGENDIIEL